MEYPKKIRDLISAISRFPTIGPKTAERIVHYLISQPQSRLQEISELISSAKENLIRCRICQNFSQREICDICSDPNRNPLVICVVAKSQDVYAIEKTKKFTGHYHVLGGTINPLEGIGHSELTTDILIKRVHNKKTQEIILAFNPDIDGETTILSLVKTFRGVVPKITRLARGLPTGADIEYADEITLSDALSGRKNL